MAVDPDGYVLLWRKAMESKAFQDKDPWLWKLWCWCLMKASWKERRRDDRPLLPGQFVCGRVESAEYLRVTPSRWHRGMTKLQEWGQVKLKSDRAGTVVTICNWGIYQIEWQHDRTAIGQQTDSKRTANGQQTDTNNKGEESKEREKRKDEIPSADKPPRARNLHFDAVVEATGRDPKLKRVASNIGSVAHELKTAGYTPEQIKQAGALYLEQTGSRPTPSSLLTYIANLLAGEKITWQNKSKNQTSVQSGLDLLKDCAADAAEDGTLYKEHGT